MNVDEALTIGPIHEVPDGGFIIFDVQGEKHLGIKVVNPPHGPYIVTLSHPDYKGTPGLWAYGVATTDSFIHIPNVLLRPVYQGIEPAVYNFRTKPGHLVKTENAIFLVVRTDHLHFGYIDLRNGQFHEMLPSRMSFQITHWKIIIEHHEGEELLFSFPDQIISNTGSP